MDYNIDYENMPEHIAIIMDGNGRWAKKRFLPRSSGHSEGCNTLKNLVEECSKIKIKYLTVYAFSTENWKRPKKEVKYLMNLFKKYIDNCIDDLEKNNIKINIIGDISKFDQNLKNKIIYLEEKSKNKNGLNLIIALNYGGRDEIIRTIKKICVELNKKNINIENINENFFSKCLDTANVPDPCLLIRTGGEKRLSNFLSWQTSYTELYFIDKFWPDFKINDLKEAIYVFQNRNRRFGNL